MKILLSILIIAISTNLYSQIKVNGKEYNKGETITNTLIDKYQGLYSWKSGNESFTLILKKETISPMTDYKIEVLRGYYNQYKDNRAVYLFTNDPTKKGNLIGTEFVSGKLQIYFGDGYSNKSAEGFLSFNQNGDLMWEISPKEAEGPRFNKGPKKEFAAPLKMILKRVEK